ncbi:MAG: hypothetical protein MZV63_34285 [Marinilabiliales bacterium]|nr:hypothetical protein [Marinilabiliales bacterium]
MLPQAGTLVRALAIVVLHRRGRLRNRAAGSARSAAGPVVDGAVTPRAPRALVEDEHRRWTYRRGRRTPRSCSVVVHHLTPLVSVWRTPLTPLYRTAPRGPAA